MALSKETMIVLVGEQPLPNLLPALYDQPERLLLLYTERTSAVCARLRRVLARKLGRAMEILEKEVEAYSVPAVYRVLDAEIRSRGWDQQNGARRLIFNLTGGTKAMALAAYSLVQRMAGRFIYLDSDEAPNRVYRYQFIHSAREELDLRTNGQDDLPTCITIQDYLDVHVEGASEGKSNKSDDTGFEFEKVVTEALERAPAIDEVRSNVHLPGSIELDLVIRRGNRVGIAELKTGGKATKKAPVAQLNVATPRQVMGTYTRKFLIVNKSWAENRQLVKILPFTDTTLIELPSFTGRTPTLSKADRDHMIRTVKEALSPEQ